MTLQKRINLVLLSFICLFGLAILYVADVLPLLTKLYGIWWIVVLCLVAVSAIALYRFIMNGIDAEERYLRKHGLLVEARPLGIELERIEHRDFFVLEKEVYWGRGTKWLYRVRCIYEEDGIALNFVSQYIAWNPESFLRRTIPVYFDRKNPDRYWVDLNGLMVDSRKLSDEQPDSDK